MADDGAAGDLAIEIDGLRKSYGGFEAVRGLSLHVRRGEIFAFLGPNGAGKTTTVEILEGFRRRDGGDVRVLGVDPAHGDRAWRARIGIVLQEGQRAAEPHRARDARAVVGVLPAPASRSPRSIALVGLEEKADDARRRACRAASAGAWTSASRSSAIPS